MMKNEDVFDVSVMLVSKEVVDVAIPSRYLPAVGARRNANSYRIGG